MAASLLLMQVMLDQQKRNNEHADDIARRQRQQNAERMVSEDEYLGAERQNQTEDSQNAHRAAIQRIG